ncbi:MAG: hypothetical protein H7Y31_18290 [Chitinophagaceae bacterium]|nr:hypothetical protein [Chitinophagaceae bacterium]
MIRLLLGHQLKAFWRSRNAGKSIAIQIFIGFITLYLLFSALALGFFLQKFIADMFPGEDPSVVFCGFILYYFAFDILVRFIMQDLPTLAIQPYLVHNIRRSQLISFLNVRSLFTILNLVPLLVFIPFTVRVIAPNVGLIPAIAFVIAILGLTFFNHFFILFIKRKSIINSWWYAGFFVLIAAFVAADYFQIFSLRAISSYVMGKMLVYPALAIIPVVMAIGAFWNNYRFLLKNLFLEDIMRKGKHRQGTEYSFLNRFGTIGELMAIDIKLLFRNKRARSILLMTVVFLFYGFIFYKQTYLDKGMWGILLVGGIFLTGLFVVNYGQFLFAWQSGHFDGMMAGNLDIRTYIKSKFVLFTSVCTAILFITSLYGLLDWRLLLVQLAGYLYNVGIHTVIAVYFATHSYKGIDISKKAAFNYQGIGASQWIYTLVIFLIPMIIYLPLSIIFNSWIAMIILSVLGLISLLLQDWWVDVLTKQFILRKHRILEGFREK